MVKPGLKPSRCARPMIASIGAPFVGSHVMVSACTWPEWPSPPDRTCTSGRSVARSRRPPALRWPSWPVWPGLPPAAVPPAVDAPPLSDPTGAARLRDARRLRGRHRELARGPRRLAVLDEIASRHRARAVVRALGVGGAELRGDGRPHLRAPDPAHARPVTRKNSVTNENITPVTACRSRQRVRSDRLRSRGTNASRRRRRPRGHQR